MGFTRQCIAVSGTPQVLASHHMADVGVGEIQGNRCARHVIAHQNFIGNSGLLCLGHKLVYEVMNRMAKAGNEYRNHKAEDNRCALVNFAE